ncbi:hypothetical protein [Microbacterium sp. A94]|uniref:hypothetical protein n=1 Tax=Microbacterium sp. A94 TaxID=3450717 RepID=UPI003F425875
MSSRNAPQVAVWYFVAATFLFASTILFFPDADVWVRIATIVVGLLIVVAGGIQLGREIKARRQESR